MAAAVLHFPTDQAKSNSDFPSQLLEAGTEAIKSIVGAVVDNFRNMDFQAISEMLREQGQEVTGAIFSKLLNAVASEHESYATCPNCSKKCSFHSNVKRSLESLHGNLTIERPYFYCDTCAKGFAPFDAKMNLAPQVNQYDLQMGAAELLTEVPYATAERLFKRLTGKSISNHSIHGIGSRLGEVARKEDVFPSRKKIEALIEEASSGRSWRPVLVVSADGAHEPTRPETGKRAGKRGPGSFQEAKGFRMYLALNDRIEQIMSWHQIATEAEFGEALRFASTLIPQELVRICLVADGAK